jgi:cyclopropane fatty-acyl-phospholipid synthase-like methyltransferase
MVDIMSKSNRYDTTFVKENMMGPSSLRIIEELAGSLKLEKGMRVLDLGCGKGLTSIFLADVYGVTVFATDLWISATENYERFKAVGLEDKIIPIHAEAHDLPFAEGFFDVAVCVDAYHYFGVEKDYLTKHLAPPVKIGGQIAVGIPGLKSDFVNGVPEELRPYWVDNMNLYSCDWWNDLWKTSGQIRIKECKEMECFDEAWRDWLSCDNDFARRDIKMMEDGGWKYFNLVSMVAEKL